MKRTTATGIAVIGFVLVGSAPAAAANGYTNWGQEVKVCNQSSCYPDGTSRGGYVAWQADDDDGPGYGWEILNLAYPGATGLGG